MREWRQRETSRRKKNDRVGDVQVDFGSLQAFLPCQRQFYFYRRAQVEDMKWRGQFAIGKILMENRFSE